MNENNTELVHGYHSVKINNNRLIKYLRWKHVCIRIFILFRCELIEMVNTRFHFGTPCVDTWYFYTIYCPIKEKKRKSEIRRKVYPNELTSRREKCRFVQLIGTSQLIPLFSASFTFSVHSLLCSDCHGCEKILFFSLHISINLNLIHSTVPLDPCSMFLNWVSSFFFPHGSKFESVCMSFFFWLFLWLDVGLVTHSLVSHWFSASIFHTLECRSSSFAFRFFLSYVHVLCCGSEMVFHSYNSMNPPTPHNYR